MARVNVNYNGKQEISDIFTLTNVVTGQSVSLIPSDSAGNFSWTGITKAPIVRNAMQTSQTSGEWSDLEYPWMAISQEDWTGGRANLRFTTDKSRFFDSRRAQTAFNQCIYNAPLDYYSDYIASRKAYTNCPASVKWFQLTDATQFISQPVTFDNYSCGRIYIHLRRRGNPGTGLTVRIKDSLNGNVIASHTYTTTEITDITCEFKAFDLPSPVTLNGTKHLEVYSSDGDNYNHWEVGCTPSSANLAYKSYSGQMWDLWQYNLLYRFDSVPDDNRVKFFMYEQQMFALKQDPITGNPRLYINGVIGKATESETNSLTDSSLSLRPDAYKGARIGLLYGNGSQAHVTAWHTITANTETKITIDGRWDITPGVGVVYVITDTPYWTQMSLPFDTYVTDIHVIKGTVYFCRGDYQTVYKMRFNIATGEFEWKELAGVYATFLQSVRDRNAMMLYRGRNDDEKNRRSVDRSILLDWESSATTWAEITTALTTKEPEDLVDRVTTITQKQGDGDNTKTIITETTESLVGGVNAGSATTTTTITAAKDQIAETDITTTVTDKHGDGDNTETTITESSTHKVGDITTGTVATTTSTIARKDQVKEQDVFSSTTEKVVDGDNTTTTVTDSTDHQVGDSDPITTSTIETNSTITENKSTSGSKKTTTITENTTKSTTHKEPTTGTGVNSSITETVTKTTTPQEPATGNGRNSTTTEAVEKTTTKKVLSLHSATVTESRDFAGSDVDSLQYVITIANFVSDNNTGNLQITLQQSEDNAAFTDVSSVTATGNGKWYLYAHCDKRYRRFKLIATGVNVVINNISIITSQIPRFEGRVTLVDNYGKITRLFEYGAEQEKSLWIFQEGMVSSINKTEGTSDTYNLDRINLDELQVTADEWNGQAVGTTNVYLIWSWLNGLQRHYNTQLEGKGPDHDEGMPADMRGRITQVLPYPGSFFASIDAGDDGYSAIMMFNENGWHNLYRAPNKGERIHDIAFQPVYGDRPDRLWAQVGDNIVWLAMPSKILYALQDPCAEYTHESIVVSSWITGGMAEVDKLWQSMSIMADYLDGKTCWIEADYQLDDEADWHPIPRNPYKNSPVQEENFAGNDESVNGKKLRYRLRLQTTDMHKTPKVNVVLIKAIGRVDIKYSYGFHFRNIRYKPDLTGEYEDIEPYDLDEILNDWANRLCTLRLNSAYKLYDDKLVFMDGLQTSVIYEKEEGYLSQITLTEI